MLEFALATEKEIRLDLAARLRKQRLAKGLSLAVVAERAGVGRATVQRLETAGHCTLENFIRIVQALGLASELQTVFALKVLSIADMERNAKCAQRIRAPRRAGP